MAQVRQVSSLDPNLIAADQLLQYDPHLFYDTVIYGTPANNTLIGDGQKNAVYGQDGNDTLYGLGANDLLSGGNGNDTMYGGDGNDSLLGGIGNDKLNGGAGNDRQDGGAGDDTLYGSAGADKMYGGAGDHDVVDYSAASKAVSVDLEAGVAYGPGHDATGDTYKDVEDVNGSAFNDHIWGTSDIDGNIIHGGAGNDSIEGNGGYDILYGEDGNDSLSASGTWNTGGATIYGGAGIDHLNGGEGDDYLYGGSGNDTLVGMQGVNTLEGGTGHDTFEFRKDLEPAGPANNYNVITDFNKSQDTLSLYDVFDGSPNNTPVNVGSDANGDVKLTFGETTVVLEGVHNAGWNSVQSLTAAGFDVINTDL